MILGNLLIILATVSDPHHHTPMYFFLINLSLNDIFYVSTIISKMLTNLCSFSIVIPISRLKTFMKGGQCHPLHYTVIMNPRLCGLLLLGCWILSVLNSSLEVLVALRLSFCTEVEIPHFFCELNMVVKHACSDTFLNNVVKYSAALLLGGGPVLGIIYSYYKIASSIRGISSAQGKYKAFSTCASHLSVVALFYFTGMGVYLSSGASERSNASTIASVLYTVITPMLNPFIYSLRNKDIKKSLNTLFVQGMKKRSVILH
ncbi:olfactory receptor 7A10-like [Suncus etruscus]|uniref:olfactory receptor 7A10-like n=1 Tax=Suncus etruscus TaxID=109475 RepID=UPI002110AC67|nr:olfactory receptor 7A10-like [Suncus etruscus]